ncbi:MAG TPA: PKD domain-containing protein [Candidatus Solibacter sp.]|nr:PKD domain-containing protein [Candidatus Solibacter sp.]
MLALVATIGSNAIVATAQEVGPSQPAPGGQPGGRSSASIQFPHVPLIKVQAMPSYGQAPMTVGFFAMQTNPEAGQFVNFRWNFGDGKVSTLPPQMLFHIFTEPGNYVVTVTGTTMEGLTATGLASVVVRPSESTSRAPTAR